MKECSFSTVPKRIFDIILFLWFFSPRFLKFCFSSFSFGLESALVGVSGDDIRDVINVSSAEVPDAKILKMIKRAEVTLELETSKEIDYSNCTEAEKEVITVLSAIYVICYLTSGSIVVRICVQ